MCHMTGKLILLFSLALGGTVLAFILYASIQGVGTIIIPLLLFIIAFLTGIAKTTTA
jgi:hypothetical protein